MWFKLAMQEEIEQLEPEENADVNELINDTEKAISLLSNAKFDFTEQEHAALDAINKLKLTSQKANLKFNARCRFMESVGFKKFETTEEALSFFIGEKISSFNSFEDTHLSQPYNYVFDHENMQDVVGYKYEGINYPYKMRVASINHKNIEYCYGPVDCLKESIPYSVLLSMAEIKELNVINVFHAIAPIEAWKEHPIPIDPIILATIWELPNNSLNNINSRGIFETGKTAHFFVAKW